MPDTIFEQMALCVWEVTGYRVPIPVKKVSERGGNRIVRRSRQNRDGAKLDDTGSVEKVWTLDADFYNGCLEEGISFSDNYPDVLNFFIKSFNVHETGTLTIPTIGKRRVRAESYEYNASFEEQDCGIVTITFVQDNEDSLTSSSFSTPSARSVSRRLAEMTTFSAEQNGVALSDSRTGISELAAAVEELITSPFEYLGDLQAQAEQVRSACARLEEVHTSRRSQVGELLATPPGAHALRGLIDLRDKAAKVVEEKQSSMPRLISYVVPTQRSIFDVAVQFDQDPTALIAANPEIGDPLALQPRTVVKVFERA